MAFDFDVKKLPENGWRWRLNGPAGRPLAESVESYATRAECLMSIRLVKDIAAHAVVWDSSGDALALVRPHELGESPPLSQ